MPPTRVEGISGVRALAAGDHSTCGITQQGKVKCWGNQRFTVSKEDGRELVGTGPLTLGVGFGCAADVEGVYCWGRNARGQLARPLELQASVQAVLALPGTQALLQAGESVVAFDGSERLCGWGDNTAKVVTASDDTGLYTSPQCGALPDVVELALGSLHACARFGSGTIACWGERYYGQLGNGGKDSDTADVAPFGGVTTLPSRVQHLVAGVSHTCALLEEGTVACFGKNSLGQVGASTADAAEEVRLPVLVSGFSGPVTALGSGCRAEHTCAIIEGGSVECWGADHAGQLGDSVSSVEAGRFSAVPLAVRW